MQRSSACGFFVGLSIKDPVGVNWRCSEPALLLIYRRADAPGWVPVIAAEVVQAVACSAAKRVTSGRWLKQTSHQPYRIPSIK